jgi:hypothetical protein
MAQAIALYRAMASSSQPAVSRLSGATPPAAAMPEFLDAASINRVFALAITAEQTIPFFQLKRARAHRLPDGLVQLLRIEDTSFWSSRPS